MNEWMNDLIWFDYSVIKNWLKASLILHTRQQKENNEKTKTKRWAV